VYPGEASFPPSSSSRSSGCGSSGGSSTGSSGGGGTGSAGPMWASRVGTTPATHPVSGRATACTAALAPCKVVPPVPVHMWQQCSLWGAPSRLSCQPSCSSTASTAGTANSLGGCNTGLLHHPLMSSSSGSTTAVDRVLYRQQQQRLALLPTPHSSESSGACVGAVATPQLQGSSSSSSSSSGLSACTCQQAGPHDVAAA
jgi:hypothetical protein